MPRKVPTGRKNGNKDNAANIALATAILALIAELVKLLSFLFL